MAEVSNPKAAEYGGVEVDHPRIREYTKNAKKNGMTKEQAQKIIGVPMEVIDKIYNEK